jgi:hypothetical protein
MADRSEPYHISGEPMSEIISAQGLVRLGDSGGPSQDAICRRFFASHFLPPMGFFSTA